jgi:hypothetical protein
MSKALYIDSNVFLTFYSLTNQDLTELNKLSSLVESEELRLLLPEQTKNEFFRNREGNIAEALKKFLENNLNNVYPNICKDYTDEYTAMKKSAETFNKNKQSLLEKLRKDIKANSLQADILINELFEKAIILKSSKHLLEKAKQRFDLGNPPGKKKSYGDAIIWETLLEKCSSEKYTDFYFISDDGDFYSEFDKTDFRPYLATEWNLKIGKNFKHYKSLPEFFRENYPNINIASESEKDYLIAQLLESQVLLKPEEY